MTEEKIEIIARITVFGLLGFLAILGAVVSFFYTPDVGYGLKEVLYVCLGVLLVVDAVEAWEELEDLDDEG